MKRKEGKIDKIGRRKKGIYGKNYNSTASGNQP
jgi:hypothetical protein